MHLPTEDKSYQSRNEMREELIVLLGGRVAAVSYTHLDVYKRQLQGI